MTSKPKLTRTTITSCLLQTSGAGSSNEDNIKNTISDICAELERENSRLKREMSVTNDKLQVAQVSEQ